MAASIVAKWSAWTPYFQSLLRIVAAFAFTLHGTMKLFEYPPRPSGGGGSVEFLSQIWFAGVLEAFGGGLLLVGLFTRPVAFLLAGEMAVAYFQAHAPRGFWPVLNGGELSLLFCFIWLYFSAAGAGPWSVDAIRRTHR